MTDPAPPQRLPPGQLLTTKWPVLHYSHVPVIDLEAWRFEITGLVERPLTLRWEDLARFPRREVCCDIHCVTRWSRFDNRFRGVPVGALLAEARPLPAARFVLVHAAPDYTTNLSLADLDRAENLLATHHGGEALPAEHGGPIRLLVPHLYFWKSAKWVTGFELLADDTPGLWERNGYHMHGDPWREQRFGRPDPARMRRGGRGARPGDED
ncbi:MAG TPA: sulfite oxidase-like oxidoreductase [Gemmatimonadales bacterium]|nr:sulfite oxidase-like oxidoreductase [Gemmatimonadales bacterium]